MSVILKPIAQGPLKRIVHMKFVHTSLAGRCYDGCEKSERIH